MKVFGVPCPTPTKKPSVFFSFLCFPINFQIKFKVHKVMTGILVFELLVKKSVYFMVHDFAGKLNLARANEIL